MSLVLSATAMRDVLRKDRHKVQTLVKRADFLSRMIREAGAHPRPSDVAEYSALRWALYRMGFVVADSSDAAWSAEHTANLEPGSVLESPGGAA
jgi:hypothetical protein